MISREEFLSSNCLKMTPLNVEKRLMHRARFVIEVVSDRSTHIVKKKYAEIKRFTETLSKKWGMQELALEKYLRTSQQFKAIEQLFKKINSGYLEIKKKEEAPTKYELRVLVYNMLFYDEQLKGDSDEDIVILSDEDHKEDDTPDRRNADLNVKDDERRSSLGTVALYSLSMTKGNCDANLRDKLKSLVVGKAPEQLISPLKDIGMSIKKIWLKDVKANSWGEYAMVIHDYHILLENKRGRKLIVLCGLTVDFDTQTYKKLVLRHELLQETIQIRLGNLGAAQRIEDYDRYLALYTVIKEKSTNLKQNCIFNFVKIKFSPIVLARLADSQKKLKDLNIKLVHSTLNVTFLTSLSSSVQIFLPILNHYGSVNFFLSQNREIGLLSRGELSNIELPVQKIYNQLYGDKSNTYAKQDIKKHFLDTKLSRYEINLDFTEVGNLASYCKYSELDKFEGDIIPTEFNKDVSRIQINRMKRVLGTVQNYTSWFADILNFHYSYLSPLGYVLLLLLVVFFDGNWLHIYFLVGILSAIFYCHPYFNYFSKKLGVHLLSEAKFEAILKTYAKKKNHYDYKIQMKVDVEKQIFLKNFQMTIQKKRSILKKYKRLQQILLKMQLLSMQIDNLVQKLKNLVMWYHPRKTLFAFCALSALLFVLLVFSLRTLLFLSILKRAHKGWKHCQKVKEANKLILVEICKVAIKECKMEETLNKHMIQKDLAMDKKSSSFLAFDKKMKELLENVLQIEYNHVVIFQHFNSINQLIQLLGNCKKRFVLSLETCRKYGWSDEWAYGGSTTTSMMSMIIGFISNIPSDKYILGIHTPLPNEKGDEKGDEQQDDYF